jgi:amino acid permease
MQKRSIVTMIILSIITCGIYTIVMSYVILNEMEKEGAKPSISPAIVLLLMIFIYPAGGALLGYTGNDALNQVRGQWGLRELDNSVAWLVLGIFFPLITLALIQNSVNQTLDERVSPNGPHF